MKQVKLSSDVEISSPISSPVKELISDLEHTKEVEVEDVDVPIDRHVDDGDCWDIGSEKSRSSDGLFADIAETGVETRMSQEIRALCESKLAELVTAESLTPDFVSEVQRDGVGGVSEPARQNLLVWLMHFNAFFGLGPDSFVVAASMVDAMLERTIVKPEHADLLGVACLRIAAKSVGAVDLQPTPREVCINCDFQFTENDLARMESIVSAKLGAGFRKVVPLDFFADMRQYAIALGGPALLNTGEFDSVVTTRLYTSSFYYELCSYRPSTVALSILMFELQRVAPECNTLFIRERLASVMDVPVWDLKSCSKCIARSFRSRDE